LPKRKTWQDQPAQNLGNLSELQEDQSFKKENPDFSTKIFTEIVEILSFEKLDFFGGFINVFINAS